MVWVKNTGVPNKMEDEKNVYAVFEAAGKAMLLSMGGASGVTFGSLYLAFNQFNVFGVYYYRIVSCRCPDVSMFIVFLW